MNTSLTLYQLSYHEIYRVEPRNFKVYKCVCDTNLNNVPGSIENILQPPAYIIIFLQIIPSPPPPPTSKPYCRLNVGTRSRNRNKCFARYIYWIICVRYLQITLQQWLCWQVGHIHGSLSLIWHLVVNVIVQCHESRHLVLCERPIRVVNSAPWGNLAILACDISIVKRPITLVQWSVFINGEAIAIRHSLTWFYNSPFAIIALIWMFI